MSAFPQSAWTKLGERVVEEYYLWHMLGPHPIVRASGVYVDGRCAGYCVSGVFNASTSGFLAKNRTLLVTRLAIKPWLMFDPIFFEKLKSGRKILKRFRVKHRDETNKTATTAVESYGILAIAVDPTNQGLGIGQLLMDDAETAAMEHNFLKMDLTVNTANQGAIRFYERHNWIKSYTNEVWKGVMIKDLSPIAKENFR